MKKYHFHPTLSYQKPMLRQIEWSVQNGSFTKNRVLPVTTLFFWKFCFSLRTSYFKSWFDAQTTQIPTFVLFLTAGVLFDGAFSLWVSLNYDLVNEIMKIRCQIYILMKKVIILRKIHVTIKSFSPPFLKHFSLSLNRKKHGSHQKETKHIHASAANLLHIRIGNLAWCKCRHCKNEVRAIDCLCCREMD